MLLLQIVPLATSEEVPLGIIPRYKYTIKYSIGKATTIPALLLCFATCLNYVLSRSKLASLWRFFCLNVWWRAKFFVSL